MALLRSLVVSLEANSAKLVSEMEKARKSVDGFKNALNTIQSASFVSLAKDVYSAATRIYEFGKEVASALNEIEKTSKILGMSATSFQEWTFAAKMSDVETQSLATGFKFLTKSMAEVATGTGDAAKYFKLMGVSALSAEGSMRPVNDVMKDIMDRFSTWADGPEKVAVALALFGKSGDTLLPLLNKGRIGFEEFAEAAKKLGIIINPELVGAGGKLEDQLKQIGSSITALGPQLVPLISELASFAELVLKIHSGLQKMDKSLDVLRTVPKGLGGMGREAMIYLGILKDIETEQKKIAWESARRQDELEAPDLSSLKKAVEPSNAIKKALEESANEADRLSAAVVQMNPMFASEAYHTKIMAKNLELAAEAQKAWAKAQLEMVTNIQKQKQVSDDAHKATIENEIEYQDALAKLDKEAPDYKKRVQELIDKWLEAKKKIEASKVKDMIDLKNSLENYKKIEDEYIAMKKRIETSPITVQINYTGSQPAAGVQSGGMSTGSIDWSQGINRDYVGQQERFLDKDLKWVNTRPLDDIRGEIRELKTETKEIPMNIDATMTSSPEVPLSEGFKNIMKGAGSVQDKLSQMGANIELSQMTANFSELSKKITNFNETQVAMANLVSAGGGTNYGPSPEMLRIKQQLQSEVLPQLEMMRAQMMMSMFQATGGKNIEEYMKLLPETPQFFQSGGYVRRTGLAYVHEGENVIPKGGFTMGNVSIVVPKGTSSQQAKSIAKELAKVIKYRRSNDLRRVM